MMCKKNPVYLIGHRNPDTDSICSAIAYAKLKQSLGEDAVAVRAGEVNPETKYVLETFKVEMPKLLADTESLPKGTKLILVDHNELEQAVNGLDYGQIVEIVDHHRLSGVETEEPIYIREEPVGCTATIIAKMYEENNIEIPRDMAGLLLSAIVSDTVLFKSPTTTERERATVAKLAKVANIDVQKYGLEMLKVNSSIKNVAALDIVKNDSKLFQIGACHVLVGQVFVMDMNEVDERKAEILKAMEKIATDDGYSLVILMATDIIAEGTNLLYVGEPKDLIFEAFKGDVNGNTVFLPGVMSRKKQVVPMLVKAGKKLDIG